MEEAKEIAKRRKQLGELSESIKKLKNRLKDETERALTVVLQDILKSVHG